MPAYDYRCTECDHKFEIVRPLSASRDAVSCPECGGDTKRVFTPVGVVFKGSGFHNTDYRKQPTPKQESDTPACASSGETPACDTCPASSD